MTVEAIQFLTTGVGCPGALWSMIDDAPKYCIAAECDAKYLEGRDCFSILVTLDDAIGESFIVPVQ